MSNKSDVIIIGGGAVGLSLAYNLLRQKINTVVLEGTYLNGGATGRNTGIIRPYPQQAIDSGDQNLIELAKKGLSIHQKLSTETGINIFYRKSGCLKIAKNDEEMKLLERSRQYSEFAIMTPQEISKKWHYLQVKDVMGGSYSPNTASVHPFSLTWAFIESIKQLGGSVIKQNRVNGITRKDGVYEVTAEKGTYKSDKIVIASGIYSSELAKMLDYSVPLNPIRREVLISEPMRPFFGPCIEQIKNNYLVTQTMRGEILGTTGELTPGLDLDEVSSTFLNDFANETLNILPSMENLRIIRQWTGVQDTSPDKKPIIGELGDGAYISCGYADYGITLAPIVGKILSEEIIGKKQDPLIKEYGPKRFDS